MGFLIWFLIGILTSVYWVNVFVPKDQRYVSWIIVITAFSTMAGLISVIAALVHYSEEKGWKL